MRVKIRSVSSSLLLLFFLAVPVTAIAKPLHIDEILVKEFQEKFPSSPPEIKAALERKDYERARRIALDALKHDDENARLQLVVANTYRWQNKLSEAKEYYESISETRSDIASGWAYLALICALTSELDDAREALIEFEKRSSDRGVATYISGQILLTEGDYPEAEEKFSNSLEKIPNLLQALYGKGFAQLKNGTVTEAAKTVEAALKVAPSDGNLLTLKADILNASGQHREAADTYKQAEQRLPKESPNDTATANCTALHYGGRLAEAIQVCRSLAKANPQNGVAIFNLAESLRKQGKFVEARDYYAKYVELTERSDDEFTQQAIHWSEQAPIEELQERDRAISRVLGGRSTGSTKAQPFSAEEEKVYKQIVAAYMRLGLGETEAQSMIDKIKESQRNVDPTLRLHTAKETLSQLEKGQ